MALWVKAFAAKPDELSWIPRTPLLEGENSLKLSSDLHVYAVTHMYVTHVYSNTCTYTQIDVIKKI